MGLDALLESVLSDHRGDLLAMLRKAYDLGWREGVAVSGRPAADLAAPSPAAEPSPVEPTMPAPSQPSPFESRTGAGSQAALFDEDESESDENDDPAAGADDSIAAERSPAAGIRASMTVGGLLRRIDRTFALDRFNIDVRIEDPSTGRHLKRNVRLSRYLKEP
jgi:hypothetical protein